MSENEHINQLFDKLEESGYSLGVEFDFAEDPMTAVKKDGEVLRRFQNGTDAFDWACSHAGLQTPSTDSE